MKYLEPVAFVVLFVPLALISAIAFVLAATGVIAGFVFRFLTEGAEPADKYLDRWMDQVSEHVVFKAPVFVWRESIQRRNR